MLRIFQKLLSWVKNKIMSKKIKNRGRIQAQGGKDKTEKSVSWNQDEPLSKKDGLALLEKLKSKLTKNELTERERPLYQAKRYIQNANGIDAPRSKTFLNRKTKDARIDIEVKSRTALFVLWL